MKYHTPLIDLLGEGAAAGTRAAVQAAGHIPDGEWTLHGPLGAPVTATVRCAACGDVLRVSPAKLEMSTTCRGAVPGRWR